MTAGPEATLSPTPWRLWTLVSCIVAGWSLMDPGLKHCRLAPDEPIRNCVVPLFAASDIRGVAVTASDQQATSALHCQCASL
jgi:hypothetical protein